MHYSFGKFFFYLTFCFLLSLSCFGQTSFEGTIKYRIDLTGVDAPNYIMMKPPQKMDLHIKGNNFVINLYEGQFPDTKLFIGDSDRVYTIDMKNKIIFKNDKFYSTDTIPPVATFTGDSARVNNEMCEIYKVKKNGEYITYYVSNKYKVNTELYADTKNADIHFLTKGLDGRIPLKIIRKTENLTITSTYFALEPKTLDQVNFMLPEGFTYKKRDNRR
jgi:hypothetical protein